MLTEKQLFVNRKILILLTEMEVEKFKKKTETKRKRKKLKRTDKFGFIRFVSAVLCWCSTT